MYSNQLETFLVVADEGSFSKASEKLYMTPTAVMKQINLLEERLDLLLFNRTPRGLKLTESGNIIYKEAKYIIKYSKKVLEKAKNVQTINKNVIRIGTSPTTPEKMLIEIWNKAKSEYLDIKLRFVPFENTIETAKEILNNMGRDIDIIASIHDDNLLNAKNVQTTKLFNIPLCITMSVNHRLSNKDLIEYEDLFGETILIVQKGWNKAMDEVQEEIRKKYPEINIENFDFFDIELFNKCENENKLIILAENFIGSHPLMKNVSVNWEYKTPFELIYSENPTKLVEKFVKIIKESLKK